MEENEAARELSEDFGKDSEKFELHWKFFVVVGRGDNNGDGNSGEDKEEVLEDKMEENEAAREVEEIFDEELDNLEACEGEVTVCRFNGELEITLEGNRDEFEEAVTVDFFEFSQNLFLVLVNFSSE
jgi:hypothetical protein